jgi:hypothetical protein
MVMGGGGWGRLEEADAGVRAWAHSGEVLLLLVAGQGDEQQQSRAAQQAGGTSQRTS